MILEFLTDQIFQIHSTPNTIENDSIDQLQTRFKRYTTELEALRNRGIGK